MLLGALEYSTTDKRGLTVPCIYYIVIVARKPNETALWHHARSGVFSHFSDWNWAEKVSTFLGHSKYELCLAVSVIVCHYHCSRYELCDLPQGFFFAVLGRLNELKTSLRKLTKEKDIINLCYLRIMFILPCISKIIEEFDNIKIVSCVNTF